MTRLEKAKELHPEMSEEQILEYCPWRFFKWSKHECFKIGDIDEICPRCWNAPYKEESK